MESRENDARGPVEGETQPPAGPDVSEALRRLGSVGPLAVAATFLPLVGALLLYSQLGAVADWIKSFEAYSVAVYVGLLALLAGIALLPTHAPAVVGGWTFGFDVGFPCALAGFFIAAIFGYWLAKRAAGSRVVDLLNEHPKWKVVYDALLGSGFGRTLLIISLLRLANSPFAITNLVFAATRVPLTPYLLGTILGMGPRLGLVVWLAAHASKLDPSIGKDRWILVGGIVLAILVLAVVGTIAKRAVARVTQTRALPL